MGAIVTKYIGPTNTKGKRIKASVGFRSITIPWDYSLDASDNHDRAAFLLLRKISCPPYPILHRGDLEHGYVYVVQNEKNGVNFRRLVGDEGSES